MTTPSPSSFRPCLIRALVVTLSVGALLVLAAANHPPNPTPPPVIPVAYSHPIDHAVAPPPSVSQRARKAAPLECPIRRTSLDSTTTRRSTTAFQIDVVVQHPTRHHRADTDSPLVVQCGARGGLVITTCDTRKERSDRRRGRDNDVDWDLDDYQDRLGRLERLGRLDRLDRTGDRDRRDELHRLRELADIVGLDLDKLVDELIDFKPVQSTSDRALLISSDGQVLLGRPTDRSADVKTGNVASARLAHGELSAVTTPKVGDLLVARENNDSCEWVRHR